MFEPPELCTAISTVVLPHLPGIQAACRSPTTGAPPGAAALPAARSSAPCPAPVSAAGATPAEPAALSGTSRPATATCSLPATGTAAIPATARRACSVPATGKAAPVPPAAAVPGTRATGAASISSAAAAHGRRPGLPHREFTIILRAHIHPETRTKGAN